MRKAKLPKIYWKQIIDNHTQGWLKFWTWVTTEHSDEMCEHDLDILREVNKLGEYDVEQLENKIMFGDLYDFAHFNRGDLYTFFDMNRVYIHVKPVMELHGDEGIPKEWQCTVSAVYGNGNLVMKHVSRSTSRPLAEEQGFVSAFSMLDKIIKKETDK